ncbi:uncharacterized protein LOC128961900 [Oppia nitens]|uniref:uncharacterized protein LOC128961900 n=1 Tax=Oppia nitens TaxID=1686743 RepID=UPI0023DACEC1|nr:uncharacterized protein LOC128961900 [Oppia nitens]
MTTISMTANSSSSGSSDSSSSSDETIGTVRTAIAWFDLTLKYRSLISIGDRRHHNRQILSRLSGSADFGTVTAVMGPSGAGLTSLLKCLNGTNGWYLSAQSRIRCSQQTRTTFIGHNQQDYLVMGLTVRQNLVYASRLKNSGCRERIDHESVANTVMAELMIADTADTMAERCSGGEQKRLAFGLELTSHKKPTLMLCDEPTTGLDSNIAEVVVDCLKRLAKTNNICIIATIHQPNTDILDMCDQLYLLAKGGHCMYWGPYRDLWQHMANCQISTDIGATDPSRELTLASVITLGSLGLSDPRVLRLCSRTEQQLARERLRDVEQLVEPLNLSKHTSSRGKWFSLKDCLILSCRLVSEIYSVKWRQLAIHTAIILFAALIFQLAYPTDVGSGSDCFQFSAPDLDSSRRRGLSCFDQLVNNDQNYYNFLFINAYILINTILMGIISVNRFDSTLQRFYYEHQNAWYSTGSYLLTESLLTAVLITINTSISSTIVYYTTGQPRELKRFGPFLYATVMAAQCTDAIGQLITLVVPTRRMVYIVSVIVMIMTEILCGLAIQLRDIGQFGQLVSNLYPGRFAAQIMLLTIYGQGRCPEPQVSNLLYMYNLTEPPDLLVQYCLNLGKLFAVYKLACMVTMLILNNRHVYQSWVQLIINKLWWPRLQQSPNSRPIVVENNIIIEMSSTLAPVAENTDNTDDNNIDANSVYYDCYESVDKFDHLCADNLIDYKLNKQFLDNNNDDDDDGEQEIHTEAADNHNQRTEIGSLSIGWSNLTLRLAKTIYSDEKLILRSVDGFVEFGTLTALMGPSGAGKTSLLRSLNGQYGELMTAESRIWLSPNCRVRRCFIIQDQREHLMTGLTVRQSIVYASKLKNSSTVIGDRLLVHHSHESIARKLMNELALTDLRDIDVSKCSSGQQKRVVMAMELTARRKPNLICVDEPTSGVDSYSAQLMIKCFRRLAKRHRLSIITSIHQPNMDIIELYDQLYILAKGGISVYSGQASGIGKHLRECGVQYCPNRQIPLEVIMKIAGNNINDRQVLEMHRQTRQHQQRLQSAYTIRVAATTTTVTTTTTNGANGTGIPLTQTTRCFTCREFYYLLSRYLVYTGQYGWRVQLGVYNLLIGMAFVTRLIFQVDLEASDSCVDVGAVDNNNTNNTSTGTSEPLVCLRTPTTLRLDTLLVYNFNYLSFITLVNTVMQLIISSITFTDDFRLFLNEHRNNWYSTESYFLAKQLMDILPNLLTIVSIVFIVDIYERRSMTQPLLLSLTLSTLSIQSMGQIASILFQTDATVISIILIPVLFLNCYTFAPVTLYVKFIRQLSNLLVIKQTQSLLLVSLYGFDRCPTNGGSHISSIMYRYSLQDSDYRRDWHLLIVQLVIYKLLTYILLKLKVNYDNWFRLSTAKQLCCRLKFF